MPELAASAVDQYTAGRLDEEDPETARLLGAALAAARRWCGWHVTPSREDEIKLDGHGGRLLALPTLALGTLTSIVDDGTTYLPADLYVSDKGMVSKRSGDRWSSKFGAITVTMTHGYDEAPDFDAAVLSLIDRESYAPTGGRRRKVGPFEYEFTTVGAGSAFTADEQAKLEQFRLERPA